MKGSGSHKLLAKTACAANLPIHCETSWRAKPKTLIEDRAYNSDPLDDD